MARVLVVDDNPFHVNLMREILKAMGFEVSVREDGSGFMEAVEGIGPDLVVMDVRLPGQSGFGLARQMKDDPRFAEVPVLAVSGLNFDPEGDDVRDSKCDAFLEKPFEPKAFIEQVRKLTG